MKSRTSRSVRAGGELKAAQRDRGRADEPDCGRLLDLICLAAIVATGIAIYWRSLHGPFLFDDADLFEARNAVRLQDWHVILTGPRPLLILSYVLNHRLWGFDPFYFRVVSLLLHIVNTIILWRIVRLICDSPGLAGWLNPGARKLIVVFAPLLFLTTPVQTESVAYISSRSEVLAATFYLLGLLVFLSSWREKRPWAAAAAIAILYGCALGSKQHTGRLFLSCGWPLAPTEAELADLRRCGGAHASRRLLCSPGSHECALGRIPSEKRHLEELPFDPVPHVFLISEAAGGAVRVECGLRHPAFTDHF
jgi:hypothetical protein